MKSVSQKVLNEAADKDVTVMIVDDSKVIRLALNKILRKNFNVIQAQDGEDAWDRLSEENEISAIFSDVSMPNLDGFGLLDRVRKSSQTEIANLPFIIITGNDDAPDFARKVTDHGGDALITKPFNTSEITDCIEKYISPVNEDIVDATNDSGEDFASASDFAEILGFDTLFESGVDAMESESEDIPAAETNETDVAPLDFEFTINEDFLNASVDVAEKYNTDEPDAYDVMMNEGKYIENGYGTEIPVPEISPETDISVSEQLVTDEMPVKLEIDFGDAPEALPFQPDSKESFRSPDKTTDFKLEIEQARKRAVDLARDKAVENEKILQNEDRQRVTETEEIRERLMAMRQRETSHLMGETKGKGAGYKITLILGKLKRIIMGLTKFRK